MDVDETICKGKKRLSATLNASIKKNESQKEVSRVWPGWMTKEVTLPYEESSGGPPEQSFFFFNSDWNVNKNRTTSTTLL